MPALQVVVVPLFALRSDSRVRAMIEGLDSTNVCGRNVNAASATALALVVPVCVLVLGTSTTGGANAIRTTPLVKLE